MKRKVIWLAIIVVLLSVIFWLVPFHHALPLPTVTVSRGNIGEQVVAVGQLEPIEVSKVKSSEGGQVGKILVKEGDYVQEGEKLLTIIPATTPDRYVDATATVSQTKSDLVIAQQAFNRDKRLIGKHFIPQVQYDEDQQRYEHALSVYQQAKEQLALLENGKTMAGGKILDSAVYSPTRGYILQQNIYEGDSVTASTDYQTGTVLFVIAEINPLIFIGEVSQLDANRVKLGMNADVQVAAFPDQVIHGTVSNVALMDINETNNGLGQANDTGNIFDMPDVYTHGFKIEISHLNFPKNVELRAGYQSTATIVTREKKNVLMLPERVVHFDENNQAYVWLPDAHHIPVKKNISVGLSDNINLEVTQGLTLGQSVVDQ